MICPYLPLGRDIPKNLGHIDRGLLLQPISQLHEDFGADNL